MPASDSVVAKGTGLQTAGLNVACKIPGCCETQQVSIELFVGNSHTSIRKPKLPTGAELHIPEDLYSLHRLVSSTSSQ